MRAKCVIYLLPQSSSAHILSWRSELRPSYFRELRKCRRAALGFHATLQRPSRRADTMEQFSVNPTQRSRVDLILTLPCPQINCSFSLRPLCDPNSDFSPVRFREILPLSGLTYTQTRNLRFSPVRFREILPPRSKDLRECVRHGDGSSARTVNEGVSYRCRDAQIFEVVRLCFCVSLAVLLALLAPTARQYQKPSIRVMQACRKDTDQEEEEQPIDETNLLQGYSFAAMLFFLIFLDNLLRWIEGRGDSHWFWLCSGKLEILVVFGVLSLVAHFLYWSGIVAILNEQRP